MRRGTMEEGLLVAGLAELESGVPITVHGPAGMVDLVVPAGASVWDVAREYAEIAGLASIPLIYTRGGRALPADGVLADHRIETGDLLVASVGAYRPRRSHGGGVVGGAPAPSSGRYATLSGAVAAVAAVASGLAGLLAGVEGDRWSSPVVWVLLLALMVSWSPGRYAGHRAAVAPVLGAAIVLAVAWDPEPASWPGLLGVVGLASAVAAGLARIATGARDSGLRVVVIGGSLVFGVGAGGTLLGIPAAPLWAVLVVLAMLAARFVPTFAIDVPDHYLIDVDRLAVSAWSARVSSRATRGRMVVPVRAVQEVADAGTRMVTAATILVLGVTVLATSQLLLADVPDLDRLGSRLLIFFSGAALLLAARSYRHGLARRLLRIAGLWSWLALALAVLPDAGDGWRYACFGVAAGIGMVMVAAAVATGRGWRSVWWSRRAELAESLAGAFAVALLFMATSLFRELMELVSGLATR